MAVVRNLMLDVCELNHTKSLLCLKSQRFLYNRMHNFYESLLMEIDRQRTILGVNNYIESCCNVKHITDPALFSNVMMQRRHEQNGVI